MQAKPFAKFIKPFWKSCFILGKHVSYWVKTLCWILEKFRNWFELIWSSNDRAMKQIIKQKIRKESGKKKETAQVGRIRLAQTGRPGRPAQVTERALVSSSTSSLYVTVPMAATSSSLYPSIQRLFLLDFNTKFTPYCMGNLFRELHHHFMVLIAQTKPTPRMPIGGIRLLISLLRRS
jgi:hypothetical protein